MLHSASYAVAGAGYLAVTYVQAYVNRASAGNGTIDLGFSGAITASNPAAGFTIELRSSVGNDTTYYTLDSTKYTAAIVSSTYIRFTLTGSIATIQASHQIRVSYTSASGTVVGLAAFSNITTLTNSSTIDLLNGLKSFYLFDETSGSRADACGGITLTDNNTVTYVGPSLYGNAIYCTYNNSEWLSSAYNAAWAGGDVHYLFGFTFAIYTKAVPQCLASMYDGTNRIFWFDYNVTVDRFRLRYRSGTNVSVNLTCNNVGSPTTSVGYHVWAWHDPDANQIQCRVNDVNETATANSNGLTTNTPPLNIGRLGDATLYCEMAMDGFFISRGYSTVKSVAEYQSWYNGGLSNHYPFIPDHL